MDAKEKSRAVLVAVDGSQHSNKAFDFYLTDISKDGDTVILVHNYTAPVPPSRSIKYTGDVEFWDEWRSKVHHQLTDIQKMMFAFEKRLTEKKIASKTIVRSGDCGRIILDVATRNDVALVVVGSRGQNKIRRTFLGSVSDYVVRHSVVPVVVVPPVDAKETKK